jgi:hypothetical protein
LPHSARFLIIYCCAKFGDYPGDYYSISIPKLGSALPPYTNESLYDSSPHAFSATKFKITPNKHGGVRGEALFPPFLIFLWFYLPKYIYL